MVIGDFNPRSREGSDKKQMQGVNPQEISIHAPARGATAILTKNPFDFLAKIDKIYYYLLPFSFYNILSSVTYFIYAFFWCESPSDFMCTSDSHQRFQV